MTDILIPLGRGSRFDNLELRYCLRSIEKHLKGVGNIFIVGEKPDWIQNVIHIPCKDNVNNWQYANNIYRKIMAGINYIEDLQFNQSNEDFINNEVTVSAICLSNNFLYFNDDHFLLKDYLAAEFPYYHRGCINTNDYENNRPQVKQMTNTIGLFEPPIYDYDIHCPILFNKELFRMAFAGKKWPEYGYGIKSLYCAEYEINGVLIDDLKFHEPDTKENIYKRLEGRPWFSLGDKALYKGDLKEVLQELFPDKSKYEL